MADKEILVNAILGVLGGAGFFVGLLMIAPFLGQTNIDFTNTTLLVGLFLFGGGLVSLIYSVLNFTEV